jgi:hypothetical protein
MFIKYIVQKCSCSLCVTSRRIRVQRDSAMVMKMIEFVHDHGPRWITATVHKLLILSLMVSHILRFPSGLHCIFNCLSYDWMVKDEWKVTWHDPTFHSSFTTQSYERVKYASPIWQSSNFLCGVMSGDLSFIFYHPITPDMTPHRKLLDCQIGDAYLTLSYDWMVKDEWKVTWHDPTQEVVRLSDWWCIFNCLSYDWMVKDEWKVTWHDPTQEVVRS